MNSLYVIAQTLARLVQMFADVVDHVAGHSIRIAALEDQVAMLQEHQLEREEAA